MTRRLISTEFRQADGPRRFVNVYRDDGAASGCAEFVCRLYTEGSGELGSMVVRPAADYFTEDRTDAFGTAYAMANARD